MDLLINSKKDEMIHNETIDTQLNHRSIRKFKDQTLTKEQLETLYSVFGQTPTSMFMQNASLLHVTDPEEKKRIQKLCNQNMLVQKAICLFYRWLVP